MSAAPVLVRNSNPPADLAKSTVYLKFQLGVPGNTRLVSASQFEITSAGLSSQSENDQADKKLFRLSKTLLDSEELNTIKTFDGKTREYLYSKCLPFDAGVHFLPLALFETVDDELRRRRLQREELVRGFLDAYPRLCQESARRLKTFFNPTDYPPIDYVRSRFTMTWQYISFGVPEQLAEISGRIFAEERQKASRIMSEATRDIQQLLRSSLCEMVERLRDRLTPDQDGKRKRLHETAVTNLTEFLAHFDMRNVTNDQELKQLVDQARGLLQGTNIDDLKSTDELRQRIQRGMSDIATKLESMVEDTPSRRVFISAEN